MFQLNLLVATKVGEEGLDIKTCCLVIRFDIPETVTSFIQSRGRARMPQSEYAFIVDRCVEMRKWQSHKYESGFPPYAVNIVSSFLIQGKRERDGSD